MKRLGPIFVLISLFNSISSEVKEVQFSTSFAPKTNGLTGLHDDWWQSATLYQIYPRSFKDSDNDGNGDLQGIIQQLDYIKATGIDGIWLSPIFKSPQVDNGYDISDYRDVDELYGTLDDLRLLLDEAHNRSLKVILDYVPNHTSDQHEWFQSSVKGISPYDDYYVWRNATYINGERRPPNNWLSSFRGSAWEWNEERQQYYYHQFTTAQPDLNYRNPAVVNEMKDVLRYWLNFGIDGFRMDAVLTLFEDSLFRDEPLADNSTDLDDDDPNTLDHIYTVNQDETYDMIYQFRDLLDQFNAENNNSYTRIMMTEVYSDINQTMLYYVNENRTRYGAHFTFNFMTFITLTKKGFDAYELAKNIREWIFNLPVGCTSNWVLGNHDQPRVSTRLGVENIDFLNILAGILPGVQITYQGEEIGQENGEVTCQQGYDPQAIKNCSTFNETSRDFERTPFQWNNLTNAGFNEGANPWLPVSEKYVETNVAREEEEVNSHYNIYKTIVDVRKEFAFTDSDLTRWSSYSTNIFSIERITDNAYYAMAFNIADSEKYITDQSFANGTTEVIASSLNSQYAIGDAFDINKALRSKETVLMRVTPIE